MIMVKRSVEMADAKRTPTSGREKGLNGHRPAAWWGPGTSVASYRRLISQGPDPGASNLRLVIDSVRALLQTEEDKKKECLAGIEILVRA